MCGYNSAMMKNSKRALLTAFWAFALTALLCAAIALPGFAQAAKPAAPGGNQAQIAHGKYLVKGVSGCGDCHTPMNEKGEPAAGQWLQGTKLSFQPLVPFPAWAGVSPKIAGLNGWSRKQAIHLLMTGLGQSGHPPRPPMPQYRMNHTDAAAVVAYLKSLK
jgi:mono/diheme cytochrome c family protein